MRARFRLPSSISVDAEIHTCSDMNTLNEGLPQDVKFIAHPFTPATSISLPEKSTDRVEHSRAVMRILHEIEAGNLDKCVLARAIVCEGEVDRDATFRNLCESYPDAFVFHFESPETGEWMGASPELLLEKDGATFHTMALAGTRSAGSGGEWDTKNVREHEIVVDFIIDKMQTLGFMPQKERMQTRSAGPVEHLLTPITADADCCDALMLASELSPTPALSGYPREEAITLLGEVESFSRSHYGGYCGPIYSNGDLRLFVNLRSMQIGKGRYCLYAGGGIVAGSDPDAEWAETERKASTLIKCIVEK